MFGVIQILQHFFPVQHVKHCFMFYMISLYYVTVCVLFSLFSLTYFQ